MKPMYVYILQCSGKSYYTGVTNDLEKRLAEHQTGINKGSYTFSRRPVVLLYSESFIDPASAIAHEKQVKGWTRKKKEALINQQYDLLPSLAVNSKKAAHILRQAQEDSRTEH